MLGFKESDIRPTPEIAREKRYFMAATYNGIRHNWGWKTMGTCHRGMGK